MRIDRFLSLVLGVGILGLQSFVSGAASISNRSPKPGELGYMPSDGAVARLNPPSLIWLHETPAATYSVQWSTQADFQSSVTRSNLPFNTYTHSQSLQPGRHFWRYRFADSNGMVSGWSATRSFTVSPEAIEFSMPDRAEQKARVPKEHPRLFVRPEDMPRLRKIFLETAGGSDAARKFASLRAAAERLLESTPTPEPEHLGSARDKDNKEMVKYWWPNREQTQKACQEAETLAFVYLVTRDPKYGAAARKWIVGLAGWDPDGPTNFRLNCEAAKPLLYRLPRAYDWACDALTSEDRAKVRKAMLRRATDAWESWEVQRGTGHFTAPYGSHANRTWHKLGECAITFLGEIPEAELWLDYAVNKFHACYPVWADEDGGWHEGVSYWGGYMSKAVWWLQVAQSSLRIDGLKKPFFAQVGDFPLYVAPPHSPNMGFGDLSYRPPPNSWGGFMEYFIRASGGGGQGAYWRWWTDQWNMKGEEGILGCLYAANLGPLPEPKAPVDIPSSKVFDGIGVASLHTTLLDSREDVHFLFKSSPFGTQSHGHNPHNTFQLNAFGEALLTTCVYRDLHGSKFHYEWAHSTVAHNGVLVNGKGQIKHSAAPHGKIIESKLNPEWDYIAGDATAAYGNLLDRYHRRVAFLKGKQPLILIYDDLAAAEPANFQFMLHGLKAFEVNESARELLLEKERAGVFIKYLAPGSLNFRQWDGFEPKPDREFPNQWHVEASTAQKQKDLGMLTMLVPYRSGQKANIQVERLESPTALGARLSGAFGSKLVLFRKANVTGRAELAGEKFEESVVVR